LSLVIPKATIDQEASYSVKLNEKVTQTQLLVKGTVLLFTRV